MKKTIIPILLSLVIGAFFAYALFKQIDNNIETTFAGTEEITLFQGGIFTTYENAQRFANSMKSATVVLEDGFYRVYIAILYNDESVDAMKQHFDNENINYYIRKINVKKNTFIEELNKYEQILLQATSKSSFDAVNKKILSIYEEMM